MALRARGHDVTIHTAERWRSHAEAEGFHFVAAPEYDDAQTGGTPLTPYEAVVAATGQAREAIEDARADLVVADILTLAPALAGELAGVPVATLIPHVYPDVPVGWPPYSLGARFPRTPVGRGLWRLLQPALQRGLVQGMHECNDARSAVGLAPRMWTHNGQSAELVLVATMPELEYPRVWPDHVQVVGPILWEPPAEPVVIPDGDGPLVLIAPSTAQDPEHRLLHAAVEGLAELPVRVLASWNRPGTKRDLRIPDNAVVVDWLSYAQTMAHAEVVITHAGHGTVMRALASGCRLVAVPAAGDMNENAARVDWAQVGVRVPRRWTSPKAIGLATERVLARNDIQSRVRALAARWQTQDGAVAAARALEAHLR